MNHKGFIIVFLIAVIFYSCEKDPSSSKLDDHEIRLQGAFILNEGNFGGSNGSLSFYSMENRQVQNNIFEKVNGRKLGDVVQSMAIIDTIGFIVVNNSNKIEVISTHSWKSLTTIDLPAGSSPRHFIPGRNGKGYVTNLYTNSVSVINLSTYAVEKSITVGANPEGIALVEGFVYVANSGFGTGNTVSVINLSTDQEVGTVKVGDNPGFLEVDSDGQIHVLCTGQWGDWNNPDDPGTDGGIFVINPGNHQVTDSLKIAGHPSKLCQGDHEIGYFLNGSGVVSYSTKTNTVLNNNLISGSYYGLNVDPESEQIFVLDAKDFQQNGELKIFDLNGQLKESHSVGIIPGSVTFSYEKKR